MAVHMDLEEGLCGANTIWLKFFYHSSVRICIILSFE